VRLVVIGLIAGLFSALFGVGGGIVVVPLLILFAGEVKPGAAAIVGLPGALGAVAGASLQQRLATRTLLLAFAALLGGLGVWFLV
jgi:uncharacterized protein